MSSTKRPNTDADTPVPAKKPRTMLDLLPDDIVSTHIVPHIDETAALKARIAELEDERADLRDYVKWLMDMGGGSYPPSNADLEYWRIASRKYSYEYDGSRHNDERWMLAEEKLSKCVACNCEDGTCSCNVRFVK